MDPLSYIISCLTIMHWAMFFKKNENRIDQGFYFEGRVVYCILTVMRVW